MDVASFKRNGDPASTVSKISHGLGQEEGEAKGECKGAEIKSCQRGFPELTSKIRRGGRSSLHSNSAVTMGPRAILLSCAMQEL